MKPAPNLRPGPVDDEVEAASTPESVLMDDGRRAADDVQVLAADPRDRVCRMLALGILKWQKPEDPFGIGACPVKDCPLPLGP